MFCLSVYVCTTCVPGAQRGQKRVHWNPGAGVTDSYEPLCVCWELNFDPLQEQPVLLTTDLSLHTCRGAYNPVSQTHPPMTLLIGLHSFPFRNASMLVSAPQIQLPRQVMEQYQEFLPIYQTNKGLL